MWSLQNTVLESCPKNHSGSTHISQGVPPPLRTQELHTGNSSEKMFSRYLEEWNLPRNVSKSSNLFSDEQTAKCHENQIHSGTWASEQHLSEGRQPTPSLFLHEGLWRAHDRQCSGTSMNDNHQSSWLCCSDWWIIKHLLMASRTQIQSLKRQPQSLSWPFLLPKLRETVYLSCHLRWHVPSTPI